MFITPMLSSYVLFYVCDMIEPPFEFLEVRFIIFSPTLIDVVFCQQDQKIYYSVLRFVYITKEYVFYS